MTLFSRLHWRPWQLIVLATLLTGCGAMATVVIAQDKTIHEQQDLIRLLYEDSAKLAQIRMQQAPHPGLKK